MPTINLKGNKVVADSFEGAVDGSVAWDDITGKPTTFAATPTSVETAVAAKTEIAALTASSTAAEIVAALQA